MLRAGSSAAQGAVKWPLLWREGSHSHGQPALTSGPGNWEAPSACFPGSPCAVRGRCRLPGDVPAPASGDTGQPWREGFPPVRPHSGDLAIQSTHLDVGQMVLASGPSMSWCTRALPDTNQQTNGSEQGEMGVTAKA